MTDVRKSTVPRPTDVEWYYERDGVQIGPVAEETLMHAARLGEIKSDTLVWRDDQDEWMEAARIPRLAFIVGSIARPLTTGRTPVSRRADQTKEALDVTPLAPEAVPATEADPSPDEPQQYAELHDAVAEEESAEATIDPVQVREILERTSRFPAVGASQLRSDFPSRLSSGRWVPPASVATNPPLAAAHGWSVQRIVVLSASSLLAAAVLILAVRGANSERSSSRATLSSEPARDPAQGSSPDAPASRATAMDAPERPPSAISAQELATSAANTNAADVVVEAGPLDGQSLSRRVTRALRVFDEQCWTRYRVPIGPITQNPSVRVELSIDRAGRVRNIEASKSPQGYRGVGPCIIGRMRGWRFPKADEESRAVVIVKRGGQ